MKMRTFINIGIAILMLFVVVAGVCYFTSKHKNIVIRDHDPVVDYTALTASDIVWSYETDESEIDTTGPENTVSVTIKGKKFRVGKYLGVCSERPADQREVNEVSGIRCWWAGAGDDIGVFNMNGAMIQHRQVEEGTAEEGGFIGEFKVIYSL
jgi:hypothetical protein